MEIVYQRELSSNYMVLRGPEISAAPGFECQMLADNEIEGLLRFRVRRTGTSVEFCYEITSRQPLSRILMNRKLRGEDIRRIVRGLLRTVGTVQDYLLDERGILLSPDCVYADPDTMEAQFCMVPGYQADFCEDLTAFLKFLLEKTDHQDADGIMTAYHLYEESRRENYGMTDLTRCLEQQEARASPAVPEEEWQGMEADEPVLPKRPPDEPGYRTGESPVRETGPPEKGTERPAGRSLRKVLAKGALVLTAAEILIWYLRGLRGLMPLGLLPPVFYAGFAALTILKFRGSMPEYRESPSGRTGRAGRYAVPEEDWKIQPVTPKEEARRTEERRMRQMEQSFAEGTVVLGRTCEAAGLILEPEKRSLEPIHVGYTPFVLGKHPELTDFCVREEAVSRMHARIDLEQDRYSVTDLNSTNGTRVNGRMLAANETLELADGDFLELGDTGYRVRYGNRRG
ncbi:MAG: FHA domain-containing protein [Clostridium sp.]|nr:FHA domain-containing protein [Clostridium sp.]